MLGSDNFASSPAAPVLKKEVDDAYEETAPIGLAMLSGVGLLLSSTSLTLFVEGRPKGFELLEATGGVDWIGGNSCQELLLLNTLFAGTESNTLEGRLF